MSPISQTTTLLREVFPNDPKFALAGFLEWQYLRSPSGQVIETNHADDVGALGDWCLSRVLAIVSAM